MLNTLWRKKETRRECKSREKGKLPWEKGKAEKEKKYIERGGATGVGLEIDL